MAIGFRAAGTFANRSSPGTGALTVNVPAGTSSGDLMLLMATSYNTGGVAINTPAGWTVIDTKSWSGGSGPATDFRSVLYWKLAGASEPAVSLTTAASSYLDAQIVGFTGVDTTTPIDAANTWGAQTVGTPNVPVPVAAITTLTANAWRISIIADSGNENPDAPSGWTRQSRSTTFITQYVCCSILAASPGVQAATTAPLAGSPSSNYRIEIGVALREFGASVGPVTPVADFTGTPTSGTLPRSVAFTDASTNTPTSWAWTFGDGATSTAQNPTHTYTSPGTYTVQLTATNAAGSNTKTRTSYITITAPLSRPGTNYITGTGIAITAADNSTLDTVDVTVTAGPLTLNTQTASYTLVLADAGKLVGMNVASANTLTVPTNASVAFPVGTQIVVRQVGTGQTTVAGSGGVTVNGRGGALKLNGQYARATLVKVATDTWELAGDITT